MTRVKNRRSRTKDLHTKTTKERKSRFQLQDQPTQTRDNTLTDPISFIIHMGVY